MAQTLEVVYDGEVFRPERPPDLKPNTRCTISIQDVLPLSSGENAWDVLESLVGTVEAPEDWAAEHDHYLYGTPERAGKDAPASGHERLLLDTFFAQALLNRRDSHHEQAKAWLPRVRTAGEVWVTEAVLVEIGNALSGFDRALAAAFIRAATGPTTCGLRPLMRSS